MAPFAGPFRVTSQAIPQNVYGTSPQTITWDVAGTDVAPINVANVKISLSRTRAEFDGARREHAQRRLLQRGLRRTSRPPRPGSRSRRSATCSSTSPHADVAIVAPPTVPVGGTVPATLSVDARRAGRRSAPSTRALTKDYDATTTATVISTAGDAALSVADPSSNAPGPPRQRRVRAAVGAAGQGRPPARSPRSAVRRSRC